MVIDTLFLIASAAFGFGLSLSTYRLFAVRNGWPMGEFQADQPTLTVLIGVFAIAVAFLFAAARGSETGGWGILILGLVLALIWTGVLRVGSQMSLFLAPIAAIALLLGWAHVRLPGSEREIVPNRTFIERERSGRLPTPQLQLAPGKIAPSAQTARVGTPWSTTVAPVVDRISQTGRAAATEIRDERDQLEVLPAAPSGLPRPFDPALVEDPALLQPRFAGPPAPLDVGRRLTKPAGTLE